MDISKQDLLCTAKSMVFSFTEISFGACGLSSPPSPKKQPQLTLQQNLHPGLKTLIHQKEEKSHLHGQHDIIHSHMVLKLSTSLPPAISPSPPLSSPSSSLSKSLSSCSSIVLDSSSSSSMGDLIGTESGVYMSSNEEEILKPMERRTSASYTGRFNGRYWDRRNAVEKEYPPPIPSLARTGNLPGRMPWVFTREYTHDGRLILREKRVQRHEYFYARRDNGRLILKLIPMDEQDENEEGYDDLELEDLDHLQFVEKDKGKEKIVEEQEEMESKGDEEEDEDRDGDDDEDEDEISKFTKFSTTYASGMFMDSNSVSAAMVLRYMKVHIDTSISLLLLLFLSALWPLLCEAFYQTV